MTKKNFIERLIVQSKRSGLECGEIVMIKHNNWINIFTEETMTRIVCIAGFAIILLSGCSKSQDERWKEAEGFRSRGSYDSAETSCREFLEAFPEGKNAAAALYMLAEVKREGKRDYKSAIALYQSFIKKYPDLNQTPVAMFLIGFLYNNELGLPDSARTAYDEFLKRFPDHQLAPSARFENENLGKTPNEIIEESKKAESKKTVPPAAGRGKKTKTTG